MLLVAAPALKVRRWLAGLLDFGSPMAPRVTELTVIHRKQKTDENESDKEQTKDENKADEKESEDGEDKKEEKKKRGRPKKGE